MDWIHNYDLFLFDFDGLLVNTEELHYLAYKKACADRGVHLDWSFDTYCKIAHYTSEGLRERIFAEHPQLKAEVSWEQFYGEKKNAIVDLLQRGVVHPMPGVVRLLTELEKANIDRCVVTHSPNELISIIREKNPIFDTIPHWITRENYSHPKPHPECYLKAIATHGSGEAKVIGFEDTPRGIKALMQTPAVSVLVCTVKYPEIDLFKKQGVVHFPTIDAIPNNFH